MSDEQRARIDSLDLEELRMVRRYSVDGDEVYNDDVYAYVKARIQELK